MTIGVIRVIVAETGRPPVGRGRGRASRAGPPGEGHVRPGSAPTEQGGPGAPSTGDAPAALQWTSRWAGEGPGRVVAGTEGEADLTLSLLPEDARAILEGRLAPSVAYMQGRLKASGDNELLLKVLEWSAGPGFEKALREWQAQPSCFG